jgi:hypothetical protein
VYPNAPRDEDGRHEPSYWRRRAVLAVGLILALGVLTWALSGGKPASPAAAAPAPKSSATLRTLPAAAYPSSSAFSSAQARRTVPGLASPAASPSGATPGPGGPCPASAVVLSLFSSTPSYSGGRDPQFEVYAVTTASGTCTFDLSTGKLHLTVMWAGRVLWDSADCARGDASRVARLSRGVPAQESFTWNRTITLPGCVELASQARPGTYEVQARTAAVASQVVTFKLR